MKTLTKPLAGLLLALALILPAGVAAPQPAFAQAQPIEITPEIAGTLERVSTYLEDIDTMRAEFLQISSTGEQAEGTIELVRPRHLRIDYKPPTPILVIANGKYLSYVDKELQQVNHVPIDETPAGFLLRENFDFQGGDLRVTGFERAANALRVSVVLAKDPLAGELTLVFSEDPMVLRKWVIVDAQGTVINVTLINARFGVDIPDTRFKTDFPMFDLGR